MSSIQGKQESRKQKQFFDWTKDNNQYLIQGKFQLIYYKKL